MNLKKVLGDAYREDMTAAEIAEALSGVPGPDELEAQKRATDRASHEAAAYKKDLRARQTAEEQAQADRDAALKKMQEELDSLRTEKQVATFKAKYIGLGFDEALAEKTAAAQVQGDTDTLFANLAAHQAAMQKELKKQSVQASDVRPVAGGSADPAPYDPVKDINAAMDAGNQLEAVRLMRVAAETAAKTAQH